MKKLSLMAIMVLLTACSGSTETVEQPATSKNEPAATTASVEKEAAKKKAMIAKERAEKEAMIAKERAKKEAMAAKERAECHYFGRRRRMGRKKRTDDFRSAGMST